MSAYIVNGEKQIMVCSYDKRPGKAMKKAAKMVEKICREDEYANLLACNVSLADDGFYVVYAVVSTFGS